MELAKKIISKFKNSPYRLGQGIFYKLKILFFNFYLPLRKRIWGRENTRVKVKIEAFNQTSLIFLNSCSDFGVLKEIFIDKVYDFNLKETPEIIFDLGSNVGFSVIWFKLKYPTAKIYAFEPDPNTFNCLKKNVASFNGVFLFNIGISDRDGEEKLFVMPGGLGSSFIKREKTKGFLSVKTKSLDSIIKELSIKRIDLLKFDIEGAEYKVFKNFKNLRMVKNLIGEVHLDLIGESKEAFLKLFDIFSVELIKISPVRFILKARNKNL
ncbi:MAG: FkbM family methyltransferase [candidate division WOR-3 bacterium]